MATGRRDNLQVNSQLKPCSDNVYKDKIKVQKKLVEELKAQWKLLWRERFNDKVRAEDVAVKDYASLRVEKGIIIHANRDFKALNFKEILDQHMIENPDRFIQPDVKVGGWHKFAKTQISSSKFHKNRQTFEPATKKQTSQQLRKGGRGWLHTT
jgi:hypothetical protein